MGIGIIQFLSVLFKQIHGGRKLMEQQDVCLNGCVYIYMCNSCSQRVEGDMHQKLSNNKQNMRILRALDYHQGSSRTQETKSL